MSKEDDIHIGELYHELDREKANQVMTLNSIIFRMHTVRQSLAKENVGQAKLVVERIIKQLEDTQDTITESR